jgi:hypothetical protein
MKEREVDSLLVPFSLIFEILDEWVFWMGAIDEGWRCLDWRRAQKLG